MMNFARCLPRRRNEARADTSLTYFEFGTLAALYFMQQRHPDFAILEVGPWRPCLDAVNIIDADLVHLTPIGLDHQAYLGDDRESIGFEKAGRAAPRVSSSGVERCGTRHNLFSVRSIVSIAIVPATWP